MSDSSGAGSVGGRIHTVAVDDSLDAAASLLRGANVGALAVVRPDGALAGILSERDIVTALASHGRGLVRLKVRDAMTSRVVTCPEGTSLEEASRLMVAHHVRHLPVVQGGQLTHMLSSRDVLERQLQVSQATRQFAERTGSLVKCVTSLEWEAVLEVIARQVPRLCGAHRSVLGVGGEGIEAGATARREACVCPQGQLPSVLGCSGADSLLPGCCRAAGARGSRLMVKLNLSEAIGDDRPGTSGALCMCGLPRVGCDDQQIQRYQQQLLGDVLTAMLNNARRYEQARRLAQTDALTGLKTRRVLEARLQDEFERAGRYGRPFCLAVLDIDRFKLVNDTLGHLAGDELLCRVGQLLLSGTRKCELAARYGGDEFVLLLPETTLEAAGLVIERIRSRITRELPNLGAGVVTISCGLTQYDSQDDRAEAVFARADAALYQAKHAGRDRVVVMDASAVAG